ncbi:MAG: tRNA lysidine(34) synthetase TilS [Pseudomonadota bacterium]
MASSRNSPPPDLPVIVGRVLADATRAGDRLVVGLSGGIDSVVLLHVLCALRRARGLVLSAIHVNHGLSPCAGQWEDFCRQLCGQWQVPLAVRRVTVERGGGDGLEAAARRARYQAFAGIATDWLVLAHQRDDQAETLLFNLLRGAGVGGAAAMDAVAEARQGERRLRLLRPLLEVPRQDIERYARSQGLRWVEDESNADPGLSRNFLRHEILARLKARFPGADAALARAAQRFGEAESLLDQLAELDHGGPAHDRLALAALEKLDEARGRNLLRWYLKGRHLPIPSARRLAEVHRQLLAARGDRRVAFPLGRQVLLRYRGEILLEPRSGPRPERLPWRGEGSLPWGEGVVRFVGTMGTGISASKLAGRYVFLAPRRGGERLQPDCRRPRRSLKNLFQEAGVPPPRRQGMPLLWCGGELVWVPDIGIACGYQCGPGEPGWQVEWEMT